MAARPPCRNAQGPEKAVGRVRHRRVGRRLSDCSAACVCELHVERRLVHQRDLLAQLEDAVLPVALRVEPGERRRKGRIVPAARDPRRIVESRSVRSGSISAARAGRTRETLRSRRAGLRSCDSIAARSPDSSIHRSCTAGPVRASSKSTKCGTGVGPQHVAAVAIAVQAEHASADRSRVSATQPTASAWSTMLVQAARRSSGTKPLREQELARLVAERFDRQRGAVLRTLRAAPTAWMRAT